MSLAVAKGQRWLRWINLDEFPCPPFGVVNITGSRIDGTEILFEASRMPVPSLPADPWDYGIPWSAAFNSETTVEAGEPGLLTVDLPAWCLINTASGDNEDDNGEPTSFFASMLKFYSFPSRDGVDWTLSQPDSTQLDEAQQYYSGLKVFATREFPELDTIWQAREPDMILNNFRIGFVGGLFTGMNA